MKALLQQPRVASVLLSPKHERESKFGLNLFYPIATYRGGRTVDISQSLHWQPYQTVLAIRPLAKRFPRHTLLCQCLHAPNNSGDAHSNRIRVIVEDNVQSQTGFCFPCIEIESGWSPKHCTASGSGQRTTSRSHSRLLFTVFEARAYLPRARQARMFHLGATPAADFVQSPSVHQTTLSCYASALSKR